MIKKRKTLEIYQTILDSHSSKKETLEDKERLNYKNRLMRDLLKLL